MERYYLFRLRETVYIGLYTCIVIEWRGGGLNGLMLGTWSISVLKYYHYCIRNYVLNITTMARQNETASLSFCFIPTSFTHW